MQMVPLAVQAVAGALNAGVDNEGRTHLLVPVQPGTKVSVDRRSRAVTVDRRELLVGGQRRIYVDVVCLAPELGDVFERFAAEICERVRDEPTRAAAIPAAVLANWRRLFEGSASAMSREQLAGLFGELHVLDQMLTSDPAGRVDHWQTTTRAVHDFVRAGTAVEVKTTLLREGRNVEVHGIEQLEAPQGGQLYLAFIRLRTGSDGASVGQLVHKVRAQAADQQHLDAVLQAFGWTEDGSEPPLFSVAEERWFAVAGDFPRLTREGLVHGEVPAGVVGIRYSIDLTGPSPTPLPDTERSALIEEVASA
jgi:hypothetical protein